MSSEVPRENMSVEEAANYLRLSKATLNKMRLRGGGPVYAQAQPHGRVIYRRCDLDAWLTKFVRHNTSEATSKRKAA